MLKKLLIIPAAILVISPFLVFGIKHAFAVSNVTTISTDQSVNSFFPQLVSDTSGYIHSVWQEYYPNQFPGNVNPGIYYSRWNGDTWSQQINISDNSKFAVDPVITSDGSNNIYVAWDDNSNSTLGNGQMIKFRSRTPGSSGTWSTIETIPAPANTVNNFFPAIAIDGSENPNITFAGTASNFSGSSVYWTQKSNGVWSTPQVVSLDESNNQLNDVVFSDMKSDDAGNLYLAYWAQDEGIYYRKYSNGSWSTPFQIAPYDNWQFVRLAVTPGGDIFITWYSRNDQTVRVRYTQGGVWQTAQTLGGTNVAVSPWDRPIMGVTTDSKEHAFVGWGKRESDGSITLQYQPFVPGVGWGSVQNFATGVTNGDSPFVYHDLWDNQHFAWAELNSATGKWEIKYRVAEGTSGTIGTTGGTLTANPFNNTLASLSVPSGALSSNTNITIQIGPVPESVDPLVVTLPRAYTFRPSGLTFSTPATATINYTTAEIGAADPRQLKPWFWDSTLNAGNGGWLAQTGTVDTVNNTIAVTLNHFSLYGISAPKVNTDWKKPDTNETIDHKKLNFRFSLLYADGSSILPIAKPEDLIVKLVDANGNTISSMQYEKGMIKDVSTDSYMGSFDLTPTNIVSGNYTLNVLLAGAHVSSLPISIVK